MESWRQVKGLADRALDVAVVVLVAGLLPYDSGKTWFTLGAALAARERGLRVGVFKPVAAHNIWYSPRTVRKSFELGMLVGNDVLRYYENGLVDDIGVANPVAIATAPPDPGKYASIEGYMSDFEDVGRIAVLSRVYNFDEGKHVHYVHEENLSRSGGWAQRLIERMRTALSAEQRSFADLTRFLYSNSVVENLNRCLRRLESRFEVVFVESFSDAFTPYGQLPQSVDLITLVAPGVVYVYSDVEGLRVAAERIVKLIGPRGYRSMHVFRFTRPAYFFETGLAGKPAPRRPHREFVEKALMPSLT